MPDEASDKPGMARLSAVCMTSDPMAVREGLNRALTSGPLAYLSPDDRGTAEIVLSEVLNNIVEHAYAATAGEIRLALSLGEGRLFCQIEDEGAPMPGGSLPAGHAPDPQTLPEGGFGWHLIRTLSCDLTYERRNGRNLLAFSLPAEQSAS